MFFIKIVFIVKIYVNDCTSVFYVDVPNLLNHSPVAARLDCFPCFIIINYVLVNIFMYKSFLDFKSSLQFWKVRWGPTLLVRLRGQKGSPRSGLCSGCWQGLMETTCWPEPQRPRVQGTGSQTQEQDILGIFTDDQALGADWRSLK